MKHQTIALKSLLAIAVLAGFAVAQPTGAPTAGDLLCGGGGSATIPDTSATGQLDTLASTPDRDGFFNLFDGKTFKGWWQNCRSGHTSDKTNGAIFRIDTVRQWIYSTQRGNNGGLLTTHKRYKHYDVVFETWPGYGNDGGLFNRTTTAGVCYQTVLDYIQDASYGGSYGEGGFTGRDQRPAKFNGNDSTLVIPGNAFNSVNINWTTITAAIAARGIKTGCASTGCTQADWRSKWKMSTGTDGWNTVRIKFYGGLSPNQSASGDKVHMISYFRNKADTATNIPIDSMNWVMFFADSMVFNATQFASWGKPNPFALQVHGGGRFPAARGTWYRNIRVRELDSLGNPTYVPVSIGRVPAKKVEYGIRVVSGALVGTINQDHQITVSDLSGRVIETFSGHAGSVNYQLGSTAAKGLLVAEIKSSLGVGHLRFSNVSE
jgi:hypothetical protein